MLQLSIYNGKKYKHYLIKNEHQKLPQCINKYNMPPTYEYLSFLVEYQHKTKYIYALRQARSS